MKNICKWLVIIIFFSMSFAEMTIEKLIENIKENKNQITSYEASVTNIMSGTMLPESKVSKGYIYFSDGKVRSEVRGAKSQIVLNTGEKRYVIDGSGNYTEIADEENITEEFSDPLKLFEMFDFTLTQTDTETIKLEGIPKETSKSLLKSISKIIVYVDSEEEYIKTIVVNNASGAEFVRINTIYQKYGEVNFPNYTETKISFGGGTITAKTSHSDIKVNHEIADEVFDLQKIISDITSDQGVIL